MPGHRELREQPSSLMSQLGIACAKPGTVEIGRVSKELKLCAALVPELTGFDYDKLPE